MFIMYVEGRFWGWIDCDEADALNQEDFPGLWGDVIHSTGHRNR